MSTLYYVVEPGKADHLLMTLPNDDPPQIGTTIQFTGGAKHAWLVVEVHRALGMEAPSVVKLKEITEEVALLLRYQRCVERLLGLFPHDPLPDACPAQSYVERLEALLDLNLLAPKYDNHLGYGEPVVKAMLPLLLDQKRLEVARALLKAWQNNVPSGPRELVMEAWERRLKDLAHTLESPCL